MTKPSVAHDGPVTAIDMHEWDGLSREAVLDEIVRKFHALNDVVPFVGLPAPKPETAAEFCARMSRFSRKAYRRARSGA